MEKDKINPDHYKNQCSIECIEAMKLMLGDEGIINFCLGNAFKYVWRYQNKNGIEDLEKAKWYISYADDIIRDNYGIGEPFEQLRDNLEDLIRIKSDEVLNDA